MVKRLRSDLPTPTAFAGLICVKPEDLTMEKANECRAKEGEHCVRMDKAFAKESLVKEEFAKLQALFLRRDRERAPLQIDQVVLISSIIQGILNQGLGGPSYF